MNLQICRLTDHPEWISGLASQFHAQWGSYYPHDPLELWEQRLHDSIRPQGLGACFVGVLEELPIAAAKLVKYDMQGREDLRPWLSGVWVHPNFRGKGIGPHLVAAVEDEAHRLAYRRLFLWTPDRNHFYGRLGWQEQQRTRYLGVEAIIMRKDLDSLGEGTGARAGF
jgi:GNAT superfamily N-acetyltransferase